MRGPSLKHAAHAVIIGGNHNVCGYAGARRQYVCSHEGAAATRAGTSVAYAPGNSKRRVSVNPKKANIQLIVSPNGGLNLPPGVNDDTRVQRLNLAVAAIYHSFCGPPRPRHASSPPSFLPRWDPWRKRLTQHKSRQELHLLGQGGTRFLSPFPRPPRCLRISSYI
jgi:hypothetical protein